MLTKQDKQWIKAEIDESAHETKSVLRSELLSFKDEILHEIRGMREELAIVIGYRQHIENHDERIEKIEHHLGFSS